MSRGILMSREGRRGVLLTKDGAFESIKLKRAADVSVGESILENDLSHPLPFYMKIWIPTLAACFSLICIFILINGMIKNKAVAAYVSFDINPSIEVSVNRKLHVLSVKPMNADAKAILEDPNQYIKMPLETFALKVAGKLADSGYFKDHPEVLITTALTNHISKHKRAGFSKQMDQAVEGFSNQKAFQKSLGHCEVLPTTVKMHDKAKKRGLSTGKYLVYLDASKYKKDLTIDKAKQLSVKEMKQYEQPKTDSNSNNINNSVQTEPVTDKSHQSTGKTASDSSSDDVNHHINDSKNPHTSKDKPVDHPGGKQGISNNDSGNKKTNPESSTKTYHQPKKQSEGSRPVHRSSSAVKSKPKEKVARNSYRSEAKPNKENDSHRPIAKPKKQWPYQSKANPCGRISHHPQEKPSKGSHHDPKGEHKYQEKHGPKQDHKNEH
ncbi:anti-sigma factor domain-containing protein [Scopulibacillus cellulosilyticus]|uniref:Anti-sigma factor domain-containing protein n=1 Tax=Scopulibacillus cellulosilyticus TaxID=2665665 RepID=A0ABW2Q2Q2_9BACL